MTLQHRREFLRRLGLSAAALPLLGGLATLGAAEPSAGRRQRVIFVFSPNGIVPPAFWPDEEGADFRLKAIMKPFEPFKDKLLTLKGVNNRVRGDGDSHMRGMSCLLTGIELFPGNIMGGGGAPAGWASGPSIDQTLRTYLQANPQTKTRLGSLEIGVAVGNRADPWTRWSYAGANQPVAPISSPYELFDKLYGSMKEGENLGSVLDGLKEDIAKVSKAVDRATARCWTSTRPRCASSSVASRKASRRPRSRCRIRRSPACPWRTTASRRSRACRPNSSLAPSRTTWRASRRSSSPTPWAAPV